MTAPLRPAFDREDGACGAATSGAVLIIEDAASIAAYYAEVLGAQGFVCERAGDLDRARTLMRARRFDLVILDLALPDGDGMDVLRDLHEGRSARGRPSVIAVTSDMTPERAVEATRAGAFDFLPKPADPKRLTRTAFAALRAREAATGREARTGAPTHGDEARTTAAAAHAEDEAGGDVLLGSSTQIRALRRRLYKYARSDATVFITGESGVGKELCAQVLHSAGPRAAGPFIAVNCAAVPGELLESELFGHVRGAFTGAVSDSKGAAAAADGGTLFLDEICELGPGLQTKLLRFLESAAVTPVGASTPRPVDVRIVCATNRNPEDDVAAGRLRRDLFYRLNVLPVTAPPLRDRGDDVVTIAEALLKRSAEKEGKTFDGFTTAALRAMRRTQWPGNVRELRNSIRQATVMNDGGLVDARMLGLGDDASRTGERPDNAASERRNATPLGWMRRELAREGAARAAPAQLERAGAADDFASEEGWGAAAVGVAGNMEDAAALLSRLPLDRSERMIVEAAIRRHGTAPKAARALGVSPSTIYRKQEAWRAADRTKTTEARQNANRYTHTQSQQDG